MIHWGWLPVVWLVGGCLGFAVAALLSAAKHAEYEAIIWEMRRPRESRTR